MNRKFEYIRVGQPEEINELLQFRAMVAQEDIIDASGRPVIDVNGGGLAEQMTEVHAAAGVRSAGVIADGYTDVLAGDKIWVVCNGWTPIRSDCYEWYKR